MQIYKDNSFFEAIPSFDIILLFHNQSVQVVAHEKGGSRVGGLWEFEVSRQGHNMVDLIDKLQPSNIKVISASTDFALVPLELIQKGDDRKWLSTLPGGNGLGVVLKDVLEDKGYSAVFSMESDSFNLLTAFTNSNSPEHISTTIIQNASLGEFNKIWTKMVCFFLDKKILILAFEHDRIQLANFFSFDIPADALYYIMWVKREVYGEDGEVPVFVNGMIQVDSPLFKTLRSYLPQLYLGMEMDKIKDNSEVDYSPHNFELLVSR